MQSDIHASPTQLEDRSHGRRLFGTWILLLVVAVLIGGSMSWMRWAADRGLTLGYPQPTMQISLPTGTLRPQQQGAFSVNATGRDLSYIWDFGDQGSDSLATGQQVSHTYSSSGSYTVKVTVTDGIGHSTTDSVALQVMPMLPVANFSYSEYYGTIYFDASNSTSDPSTSIASYSWDFGDGNTNTYSYPQISYNYNNTGTYTVQLTVTDATGQQSMTYSAEIVVS